MLSPLPCFATFQKVEHTKESRLARQLRSNVRESDWFDRIHLDLTLLHPVPVSDYDVRARPDADAAGDVPAPNSFAKPPGEHHAQSLVRPGIVNSPCVVSPK